MPESQGIEAADTQITTVLAPPQTPSAGTNALVAVAWKLRATPQQMTSTGHAEQHDYSCLFCFHVVFVSLLSLL